MPFFRYLKPIHAIRCRYNIELLAITAKVERLNSDILGSAFGLKSAVFYQTGEKCVTRLWFNYYSRSPLLLLSGVAKYEGKSRG